MLKRICAIGVAVLSLGAFADSWTDQTTGITWTYTVKDASVVLGDGKNPAVPTSTQGSLSVPSTIAEMPVTSVGDSAFRDCVGLTSVTIPSSVTNIGDCAFCACSGLTCVTIPSSVTNIGCKAFVDCNGLMSVAIPEGMMSMGGGAFCYCVGLTCVTIPSSVTSMGYAVFDGCSGLTNVTISTGVTCIGCYMFAGCDGLTSVTIPSSVTNIGDGAFEGCSGLTNVTISTGVTSIGIFAFEDCVGLTSVTIPFSVQSVGEWAFYGCKGLNTVDFEGEPPNGIASAEIKQDAVIRYNIDYEDEWRPVVAGCGFLNATAYMPKGAVRKVKSVEANQRYPWNGLVDIAVTLACSAEYVAKAECLFVATNVATGTAVPVASVTQNGSDAGSGTTWTRRFIWNAAKDVGEVKIDDLALTVDAFTDCVQLWANGPFWAKCNVGASKPEEYGYYFWWGDTVGYKRNAGNNGWVSVKDGTSYSFSGCPTYGMNNSQLQSAGYIDSTGNLVASHDAATAHLGAPWRMPTDAEFAALINNCDTQWTTRGGVYGRLVTGRGAYATKSIFLPAAGYGNDSYLSNAGSDGYYWSSTPNSGNSYNAWRLDFYSSYFGRYNGYRSGGRSVRSLRGFAK